MLSLISKIPIQVYFSPNPFLLSIISPYTKKSFKINDINPNEFWLETKKKNFIKYHNFLWLNLIDRKVDGKNNVEYDPESGYLNKEGELLAIIPGLDARHYQ